MYFQVTTAGGQVKYRQVQLEVVTPEALILGKEEYHIQQGGSLLTKLQRKSQLCIPFLGIARPQP